MIHVFKGDYLVCFGDYLRCVLDPAKGTMYVSSHLFRYMLEDTFRSRRPFGVDLLGGPTIRWFGREIKEDSNLGIQQYYFEDCAAKEKKDDPPSGTA